ncbi:MAG TPA: rRNA maturation RNase YbeY [Candidatus Paceibacterota bacterium]
MSNLSIAATAKHYPPWPYQAMKDAVLGKQYSLTLSFVGATRAQRFNQTYRQKEYVPNVLSFPLDEKTGEIIICPEVAKREAKKFSLTVDGYIAYLFIHGCVHLKGHDHGDTMDKLEQKFMRQFAVK